MRLPFTARRTAFVGALVAAGLLAAFAVTSPGRVAAAIQTGDCTPGSSWPAANGSLASQVLSLVNQHRAGLGKGQLVVSPTLSASAVWKARHMANFNYFSHDDPATSSTPARTAADRVATCGYTASWGENIAEGFPTAQSVLDAWLNSPGHKANIENGSYVATGVGVATASNGAVYWVQDFGTVADGGTPPTTTTTPATTSTPATTTTPPTTSTRSTTTARTTTTTPATTTSPAATTTTTAQGTLASLRLAPVQAQVGARRLALTTKVSASGAATFGAVHVKCVARIGSRSLRVVVNAYGGSRARCAWRLPRDVTSAAKARGWIRVTQGPLHVRRSFGLKLG